MKLSKEAKVTIALSALATLVVVGGLMFAHDNMDKGFRVKA